MYFVYVLYSKAFDKIYIGYTSDIYKRLKAHNHYKNKGWTKKYQPWEIIYKESIPLKNNAIIRERQLKSSQGRAFIRSLIL
jgi:putative endonuclease